MDEPVTRFHLGIARQCLAESVETACIHDHAGVDERELALNGLVERALHAYEAFRRHDVQSRGRWADATESFDPQDDADLRTTGDVYLGVVRALVRQLDRAALDGLAVRNALALRNAFSTMVSLEAFDHGPPNPAIGTLAQAAQDAYRRGDAQPIDGDPSSFRTWEFVKQTAALPAGVHELAQRSHRTFFAVDPRHPAVRGRRLYHSDYWCVDIGFEHRALAVLQGSIHIWFFIGSPTDLPG